jgi:predicted metal-binding protein
MEDKLKLLITKALESGAAAAGIISPSDIRFDQGFRLACEQNSCGQFGTNWMCPPAVGPLEDLIPRIKEYSKGVVFQTVYQMEDSFDFEGMMKAADIHRDVFERIYDYIRKQNDCGEVFPLNAGACKICDECTYPAGKPCRFPQKAVASIEAYGIDVNAMLRLCGIPYNNGPATVSYVGLFLFK